MLPVGIRSKFPAFVAEILQSQFSKSMSSEYTEAYPFDMICRSTLRPLDVLVRRKQWLGLHRWLRRIQAPGNGGTVGHGVKVCEGERSGARRRAWGARTR